jgi:hypothetical protein
VFRHSAVETFLSYWLRCRPNLSFLFVIQHSTALCRYHISKHPNITNTTKAICYCIHYFSQCLFFTYYQHNYCYYWQLLWSILITWPAYSGREYRKRSGKWRHTCISSSSSPLPTARGLPLCGILNLCIDMTYTSHICINFFLIIKICVLEAGVISIDRQNIHYNMNSCGVWN